MIFKHVYWYMQQISGEHLQDHWSSGLRMSVILPFSRQDSQGIGPLRDPHTNEVLTSNTDKANLINDHLQSVFTPVSPLGLNQLSDSAILEGLAKGTLDLQKDLSNLEAWESEWLMAFNPDKCEVIRITKKHKPFIFDYKLHNKTLQTTKNAKYLGLNISDDLSWTKHINQTTAKGNNTLKFIKRNIQTHNIRIKETAYKTYVRPLLEYSSSVWDPWQKKYIEQLEMVQHRAVRYILNAYASTSSVTEMLKKLSLPTLKTRRKISSLVMLYKIQSGLVRIPLPPYITPTMRNRLSIPYSRINAHLYSFFPRTARLWNNLPPDLISCPDLESFRAGLASHLL